MRVLVVATQVRLPDTHGGSTHVGELVAHLREDGPVLVLGRRGSTAEGVVGVSFKLGYPPGIKHVVPLLYLPRASFAARRFRPDVIYERASSYGLGAMLSATLRVPMLSMVLDEHYSALSLRRAKRIVATRLDIVPARYRQKAVKVSWGANEKRFHPGISGERARRQHGLTGTTLCYVGSFKRWHGLESLVAAVQQLEEPLLQVLMVGDGPLRPRIERDVRAAGLSHRFVFTGAVAYNDVPELVAAADICLAPFSPSRHPHSKDGFVLDPLKVFEYLAMAKPTITVDSTNIQVLFRKGEHLLTVPPDDPDALAEAISRLCDDLDSARAMAERGRQRVVAHHTWRAHADHLRALFDEMTGPGR